ncbi:MAG: hypothetical protein ACRDTM_03105 [Micromonosporaceae bacterium]
MPSHSRIAEAFPRRHAAGQVTADAVERAWLVYHDEHVPSIMGSVCLAEGCYVWPCQPYQEAVVVLIAAGHLGVRRARRAG